MPKVKQFDEKDVLEKAMQLFWKKGYYATSIQDLVNHLGINRSSIYDTYGGKKELFDQAFLLYRSTNVADTRNFLKTQKHVREGFKRLFEMTIEESLTDTH